MKGITVNWSNRCYSRGHITTNIPFACYQLYGRNLQTKSSLSRCLEVMSTSKRNHQSYQRLVLLPYSRFQKTSGCKVHKTR